MGRELGFWLAVVLIAVVGSKLFAFGATTPLGDLVPGYRTLAAWPGGS